MFPDAEKVLRGIERCNKCTFPSVLGDQTPYLECEYTIGQYCGKDKLIFEAKELVKDWKKRGIPVCHQLERVIAEENKDAD